MALKENKAGPGYAMTTYHPLYQRKYLLVTARHHQTISHTNVLRRADARLDFQQKLGIMEKKNLFIITYKHFTSREIIVCMFS